MIKRFVQSKIEEKLFKGKIIILYGARQVGKTTLLKEIKNQYSDKSIYLNCDEPDIKEALTDKTSTQLKSFIGENKLVLIDEAQRVKNIGLTLKLFSDNFNNIQIIATGSSSFELSNNIIEPLTGRKFEFHLHPFSIEELRQKFSSIEIKRIIDERLIYGMYPEVVLNSDNYISILKEITKSYLYKDILQFQNIKNSDALEKLLKALALQIGNEVSYNELASIVGIDKKTIENYIQILEKSFIIFRLNPFSRNNRNELKKLRKIYFVDTGIRNSLINNLNNLSLRNDSGNLWENFLISERIKYNENNNISKNLYFWRNHNQKEIDLIEEYNGNLFGYEFKTTRKQYSPPKDFLDLYPGTTVNLINHDNFFEFV